MRHPEKMVLSGILALTTQTAPSPAAPAPIHTPEVTAAAVRVVPVAVLSRLLVETSRMEDAPACARLQHQLQVLRDQPGLAWNAGTALRAALAVADQADSWSDARQVLRQAAAAMIENPEDFRSTGWQGTRAVLILGWWASRHQELANASRTLQAFMRTTLERSPPEEVDFASLALRASLEAAERTTHAHSRNWILRRSLWKLAREPGPVSQATFLRVALHAAGGLALPGRAFLLEAYAARWLRSGILSPPEAAEIRRNLDWAEENGGLALTCQVLEEIFRRHLG